MQRKENFTHHELANQRMVLPDLSNQSSIHSPEKVENVIFNEEKEKEGSNSFIRYSAEHANERIEKPESMDIVGRLVDHDAKEIVEITRKDKGIIINNQNSKYDVRDREDIKFCPFN